MGDLIERLRSASSGEKPHLPGFMGAEAFVGRVGLCRFICTRDHDGQIEVSLSLPGPRRPSAGQVNDFFAWLGKKPTEAVKRPTTWHCVVRAGAIQ